MSDQTPTEALAAELCQAMNALYADRKRRDWLAGQGVDIAAVNHVDGLGPLGLSRIASGDRFYEPAEAGGSWAIIQPWWRWIPDPERWAPDAIALAARDVWAYAEQYPCRLALIDLLAWSPRQPGRIWTRRGVADLLGYPSDGPIQLHQHPLAWLRARGEGIAPATSDRRLLRSALLGIEHLVCRDVAHGRAVRELLAEPLSLPRLSVPAPARVAA